MSLARRTSLATLGLLAAFAVMGTPGAAWAGDPKQDKINAYIDMLNAWSKHVHEGRARYLAWADAEQGPTCKERDLKAPSAVGDSAAATYAGYTKAFKKKPALPADAAANRMVAALTALIAPGNEAAEYYFKRKFKDDGCKRGKELHAQLVAGWNEYLDAEREVRAFVVAYNDEREAKSLAATKKKYGEKFRYHLEKQLADAKVLIREIDTQFGNETPDLAAVRARLDAYGATADAVAALTAKVRDDKSIYGDLYQGGYIRFTGAGDDFRTTVGRLLEVAEAPANKSRGDRIGKSYDETIEAYNRMIDAVNKVRFSSKIK